jgi:hypothetical protein
VFPYEKGVYQRLNLLGRLYSFLWRLLRAFQCSDFLSGKFGCRMLALPCDISATPFGVIAASSKSHPRHSYISACWGQARQFWILSCLVLIPSDSVFCNEPHKP